MAIVTVTVLIRTKESGTVQYVLIRRKESLYVFEMHADSFHARVAIFQSPDSKQSQHSEVGIRPTFFLEQDPERSAYMCGGVVCSIYISFRLGHQHSLHTAASCLVLAAPCQLNMCTFEKMF